MTSKDVSSIKNRCTEENKAKCESEGKLCNPNPKSKNICFNNTEINRKKIKDAMNNKKFADLMKYLNFKKDNKYNYKIIALFKKDFYKYFLPKNHTSLSLSKNKLNRNPKYNSI